MRVLHENEPGHPDNHAFIASHVGLNNDEQWDDFRELDIDDQKLFHNWMTSQGDDAADIEPGTGTSRRFDVGMKVDGEILGHFIAQSFLDPEDDRVLDKFLDREVAAGLTMRGLGVTREVLRAKLRKQQKALQHDPRAIPVSPQRRRRTTKKRLAERTGSVVARILKDLGLSWAGRQVGQAVKLQRGRDNLTAVTTLVNNVINEHLGIGSNQRNKPTADQLEQVFGELDTIADRVRDEIRNALDR